VAEALLDIYLALWRWVPSRRFLNQEVLDSLAPGLGEESRRAAQRAVEASLQGTDALVGLYRKKAGVFLAEGGSFLLDALMAKVLGV
jgi:hypothetical protein